MRDVELRAFEADDLDWLTEAHQRLYSAAEGFDDTFGPLVRSILEAFVSDHDPSCEAGWVACRGPDRLGSIFCVRHDENTAKLRLFLLEPAARGQKLGQVLLDRCTGFARDRGYSGMTLWTHESHTAACALYARNGWTLVRSEPVHSFGVDLVEQTWCLRFE